MYGKLFIYFNEGLTGGKVMEILGNDLSWVPGFEFYISVRNIGYQRSLLLS